MLRFRIATNEFKQFAIWKNANRYSKYYSIGLGYKVLIITRDIKENN